MDKTLFKNWRILFLLAAVLISIWAIAPQPWIEGAAIRSVEKGSAAELAGIHPPGQNVKPVDRERVVALNNRPVESAAHYSNLTKNLEPNRTITIRTNRATYRLVTQAQFDGKNVTREITEIITQNQTINGTSVLVNRTVKRNATFESGNVIGTKSLGIKVFDPPITNIRTGLDLQGGTRVLLEPEVKLAREDLSILIENMKQRLNVYGLSDLTIRDATDLSGNQFILVEIAGVSEEEVQNLLAKQGKFEAKIKNDTTFVGGRDITYVCRSADCSGIDPFAGCGSDGAQFVCRFRFSITLTQDAAQRQANITDKLEVIPAGPGQTSYLSAPIDLYLDDQLVDSLSIGAELKGSPATSISVSGSGVGATQRAAVENALSEMHRLQTVLITGSLPIKLTVIKTDSISATLGEKFTENAMLIAFLSIISVIVILFVIYRNALIAIPIFIAMLLEIFITLGTAAIIGWNIDLSALAGIIAAVGTGVNDQIVITDEALRGKKTAWKDKLKDAFFIIFGAYLTVVVAMAPLLFAGAGLFKGFAITTIIGITVGVFITRPAFAVLIEKLLKK